MAELATMHATNSCGGKGGQNEYRVEVERSYAADGNGFPHEKLVVI